MTEAHTAAFSRDMARLERDLFLEAAVGRSVELARAALAAAAPVRTGRLRGSASVDGATAYLDTPYAQYVDARRRIDERAAAASTPPIVRTVVDELERACARASAG